MKNENGIEKSATLKGSTKYRDIDTGAVLDAFEDGRNLELVSVRMPVLTTTGKNLFDGNYFRLYPEGSSGLVKANANCRSGIIKVKPNTTYIGSRNSISSRFSAYSFSEYPVLNSVGVELTTNASNSFTTTNDTKYIIVYVSNNNEEPLIQIEEGSTPTSYEPYKSNILTVNEDVELRGIGDVQDTLDLVTSEVTKRIGEVVLDGSESWYIATEGDTTNGFSIYTSITDRKLGANVLCEQLPVCRYASEVTGKTNFILAFTGQSKIVAVNIANKTTKEEAIAHLKQNPIKLQIVTEPTVKTVDLTIQDQDNQPQERMKLFPNGHINTSSSTIPPILELKGITHNNKLNMTTTNGTNNTQLATLDNLALDGIICRDGTVVRDSYDVESGLYTKRVFRFTVDEEFIEKYRSNFALNGTTDIAFNMRIGVVANCGFPKITRTNKENANNIATTGKQNSIALGYNNMYIQILKEEVSSYDVDGILEHVMET